MKYEKLHLKDFYPVLGNDGCDPTVELYFPYNMSEMKWENKKRPCMIVFPGGGYTMCSQRESEPVALRFIPEGYNVFVLTYSVTPHRFPTQLREIAALIELINEKADEWNCDTERIVTCGFSAGAHISALYANLYDTDAVREIFPESRPVTATVLCYPVVSADPRYSHKGSFYHLTGHDTPTEEDIETLSADKTVKENTPPAFIWHTAEDRSVPVVNSMFYATALSKNKIPFELHIYPFGRHGLSTSDAQTLDDTAGNEVFAHNSTWFDSLKKWLKLMNLTDK